MVNIGNIKICYQVNSEEELLSICEKAESVGLRVALIKDTGLTGLKELTYTCYAIGPDLSEKSDPITKQLKLY